MVFLEIEAVILDNKHLEFSQSKLAFINDVQRAPGYVNFLEKPGKTFQMKVSWENKACIDNFMQSEQFHFFKGAIITLSNKNTFNIVNEDLNT